MEHFLTKWAVENEPSDEMIYKKGYWDQIIFLRGEIIPMFYNTSKYKYDQLDEYYKELTNYCEISGVHRSKSIILPVLTIEYKGCLITMRNNFYNWNISVIRRNKKSINLPDGMFPKDDISSCYFEGFPEQYIINNTYNQNNNTFSCCIGDNYMFFTFMWLLRQELNKKGG